MSKDQKDANQDRELNELLRDFVDEKETDKNTGKSNLVDEKRGRYGEIFQDAGAIKRAKERREAREIAEAQAQQEEDELLRGVEAVQKETAERELRQWQTSSNDAITRASEPPAAPTRPAPSKESVPVARILTKKVSVPARTGSRPPRIPQAAQPEVARRGGRRSLSEIADAVTSSVADAIKRTNEGKEKVSQFFTHLVQTLKEKAGTETREITDDDEAVEPRIEAIARNRALLALLSELSDFLLQGAETDNNQMPKCDYPNALKMRHTIAKAEEGIRGMPGDKVKPGGRESDIRNNGDELGAPVRRLFMELKRGALNNAGLRILLESLKEQLDTLTQAVSKNVELDSGYMLAKIRKFEALMEKILKKAKLAAALNRVVPEEVVESWNDGLKELMEAIAKVLVKNDKVNKPLSQDLLLSMDYETLGRKLDRLKLERGEIRERMNNGGRKIEEESALKKVKIALGRQKKPDFMAKWQLQERDEQLTREIGLIEAMRKEHQELSLVRRRDGEG